MAKEIRHRQAQLWDPAGAPARSARTGWAFGPGAPVAYTAASLVPAAEPLHIDYIYMVEAFF